MHWKRTSQALVRSLRNQISKEPSPWQKRCIASLAQPAPPPFSKALFNFTVDFELIWSNGNLGGREHSLKRRVFSAERQAENFYPFLSMLHKIGFPVSWAVVGKVAEPDLEIEPLALFQPPWAKDDWYSLPESVRGREHLWVGRDYLKAIHNQGHEVLSHGYAHVDYADPTTTEKIAWTDMRLARGALKSRGLEPAGFVFPRNEVAREYLLRRGNHRIARGASAAWHVTPHHVLTSCGFWISPGVTSFRELKSNLNFAVERRAFFHPWMHLIECEIRCRDIQDFYRPLFEHALEEQARGRIQIITFREIADVLVPLASAEGQA